MDLNSLRVTYRLAILILLL